MQTLQISGPITETLADQVLAQLATFDRGQPLTVVINSDGGSVQAGVSIYNALASWPAAVVTEVAGWALSAASLIAMAGARRVVHPASVVMVHGPQVSAAGNASEHRATAEVLETVARSMLVAYRRTGQPDATIEKWLSGPDFWFTSDEALAAGLATEIATPAQTETAPEFANAMAWAVDVPSRIQHRILMTTNLNNPTVPTRAAIEAAAIQAEAQRRTEIRTMAQPFMAYAGLPEFVTELESDTSVTATAAGHRILARLGAGAEPIAGGYRPRLAGDDRLGEFCAAASDALMIRAGLKLAMPHPATRDVQRLSFSAMAEQFLSLRGANPRDRSAGGLIEAALSTDDFTQLLANTAGKSLALGYEQAPVGHTLFTGQREVPDFKKQTLLNLSEAPALEEVPELAEYKNGSLSESSTTFEVATFGRILDISRQALVNDDLGGFTTLPSAMGMAARRLEADKVFAMLTGSPVMSDGKALFHVDHGNLGAPGPLNIATLAAARAAMRKQKGIGGLAYLDLQPRFLVVPVALETQAEQLIASLVDPARQNDTPNLAFVRGLTLIADPRLDAVSETAWYLAASPAQVDGILRAYLAGQTAPTVEEHTEFRPDVLSMKVRLDFGVGVIDHRALYKNPGA